MTIQFPTSPNICSALPGENNQQNITFYPMQYDCLINKTHFVYISDTLAGISSSGPFFNCLQ